MRLRNLRLSNNCNEKGDAGKGIALSLSVVILVYQSMHGIVQMRHKLVHRKRFAVQYRAVGSASDEFG